MIYDSATAVEPHSYATYNTDDQGETEKRTLPEGPSNECRCLNLPTGKGRGVPPAIVIGTGENKYPGRAE